MYIYLYTCIYIYGGIIAGFTHNSWTGVRLTRDAITHPFIGRIVHNSSLSALTGGIALCPLHTHKDLYFYSFLHRKLFRLYLVFSTHTQNCRINEASNSPKPLVVSSLSLLNLFRAPKIATDEKLSSHFLSLKPSNPLASLKLPRMRNCQSLFLSFISCHQPINLRRSSPYHHIHFITGTRKSKLRNCLSCF